MLIKRTISDLVLALASVTAAPTFAQQDDVSPSAFLQQTNADAGAALEQQVGAGGNLDTNTARSSIVGFVETKEGLMFDLSLAGTRFTKTPV